MYKRALLTTLCGTTLAASVAIASAATIGLMAPLSGPQALVGQDQVDGFMLGSSSTAASSAASPSPSSRKTTSSNPRSASRRCAS